MILRLTPAQAAQLTALAEAAWPREACALLVGTGDADLQITEIVPADNLASTPEREFELDSAVHVAVMRRLREAPSSGNGGTNRIIGHWHSHPNGRATPSVQDAAMIYDAALVWLISAVQDGHAGAPQAWRPDVTATGFAPLALEIEQQDS